jgi:tripartite-type tricarboxylate transporter receptor subunit TctC
MRPRGSTTFLLLALIPAGAFADDYPSRPIRLVVPYPAGGPVDIMSRLLGQKLSEQFPVQIVVDNRAGANGNIAGEIVARANPDGYTLLMGANGSIAVNPSLYRKMPYDPQKDLAPVSLVAAAALMMVVHPSVPARSAADFIALAKKSPGKLNYASAGSGSTSHLCSALLETMAGIDMVHVPYKGSAPALNDVVGGQVQMLITGVSSALPHQRSGKLRALGVTSPRRLPALPEVPAIAETVHGYEVLTWYGVFVPRGTPQMIIKRLHSAVVAAVNAKDTQERLTGLGAEAATNTPDQFAAMVRDETVKWGKVVRTAGIAQE